jgi:hypothetical protein
MEDTVETPIMTVEELATYLQLYGIPHCLRPFDKAYHPCPDLIQIEIGPRQTQPNIVIVVAPQYPQHQKRPLDDP